MIADSSSFSMEKRQALTMVRMKKGDPSWRQKHHSAVYDTMVLCLMRRTQANVAYGIIVPRKVGNAVMRNKIKRRLRHAFIHLDRSVVAYNPFACLIIVRHKNIATYNFASLCEHIQSFLCDQVKKRIS